MCHTTLSLSPSLSPFLFGLVFFGGFGFHVSHNVQLNVVHTLTHTQMIYIVICVYFNANTTNIDIDVEYINTKYTHPDTEQTNSTSHTPSISFAVFLLFCHPFFFGCFFPSLSQFHSHFHSYGVFSKFVTRQLPKPICNLFI